MLFDPALEVECDQGTHRARSTADRSGHRAIIRLAWCALALAWTAGACAGDTTTAANTPAHEPAAGAGVEATQAPPPPEQTSPPTGETPSTAPDETSAGGEPVPDEGETPPPMPVPAVWVDRDIQFAYMGRTSYYTCDGLKSKVSQILKQMGVKPGFKVTIGSCFESHGAELMPTVRIRAAFPTEATPEVLESLKKDAPERELIRRQQGLPTDFDPSLDQFAAVRTIVTFRDGKLGPIDPGDCELIETMRDKVFKPVGMRIVQDRMRCQPGQVSMGSVDMKVEILEQPQPLEAPPEKGKEPAPAESSQEAASPGKN
jgi:hypothetical protein